MARKIIQSNDAQIEILKLVYTFRYVSAPLLASLRRTHETTTRVSLEKLRSKGLLNKKFDKSYRLLGKPAGYSLNPDGVRFISEHTEVNKKYAHSMYKNASASESFVDHSLNILASYIALSESYPDTFTIFTRAETVDYEDNFPKTLPNLYLSRNKTSKTLPNYYMLDILSDVQKNVMYKKIEMYIDHHESGDWEEDEYPTVLLVLDNSYIEDFTQKIIEERKDSRYILDDDLVFMTTTRKALLNARNINIWTSHKEELASL